MSTFGPIKLPRTYVYPIQTSDRHTMWYTCHMMEWMLRSSSGQSACSYSRNVEPYWPIKCSGLQWDKSSWWGALAQTKNRNTIVTTPSVCLVLLHPEYNLYVLTRMRIPTNSYERCIQYDSKVLGALSKGQILYCPGFIRRREGAPSKSSSRSM